MRITCPSCGAQYEVAAGVIPEGGREVQCSDCNHLWFETGIEAGPEDSTIAPEDSTITSEDSTIAPEGSTDTADFAAALRSALAEEEAHPVADPALTQQVTDPAESVVAAVAASPAPAAPPAPAPPPPTPSEAPPQPMPFAPPPPAAAPVPPPVTVPEPPVARPALSAEVAAILREEAERERAARLQDRAPVLETQGELGLDTLVPPEAQRAEEARRRMARLRGEPAPQTSAPVTAAPSAAAAEPPRARERLPDIEEINSSLRAAADRSPALQPAGESGDMSGRAFRYGFALVLIVAAIATAVYGLAGQIGRALPVLAAPLESYVAGVDDLRLWLDLSLQSLLPGDAPAATDTPPAAPVTDAPAAPTAPAG